MLWTEVRSWCKKNGYTTFREKIKDSENRYDYYWAKEDDPSVTGLSTSVGKLATDIYNHMTDYKWLDYQKEYLEKQTEEKIHNNEYGLQ
jgi:hypothetical protein